MGSSCAREPLEIPCEPIAQGALVITEVRSDQGSGAVDLRGAWLEIYNASPDPVALPYLTLAFTRIENGDVRSDFVRDRDAVVASGGYYVLGIPNDAGEPPPDADYTFATDVEGGIPDGAIIEVLDCERRMIDRVIMRSTPAPGTLNLDGSRQPSAADNDDTDLGSWCDNTLDTPIPQTTMLTEVVGTPGIANVECP